MSVRPSSRALIAHLRLSPLPRAPACPNALMRLRASVVVLRYRVSRPTFLARNFSFSRELRNFRLF